MTLCLLGVDPGLTGALAFYFPDHPNRVSVYDMPIAGGEVDVFAIRAQIETHAPACAMLELVGPRPTDGRVQAFKFGGAYHAAQAALKLALVPLHRVTPQVWKKHFKLPGGDVGKEKSRELALRFFPASSEHFRRKADHNRAEAALLARYAAEASLPFVGGVARLGGAE